MIRDYNRKIAFSYFLPYGFVSRYALMLAIKVHPAAFVAYDAGQTMEQRVKQCVFARNQNTVRIRNMEKGAYAEDKTKNYGKKQNEQVRFDNLTQSGFYLLTSTPDMETEKKRLDAVRDMMGPNDRNQKEINYMPSGKNRNIAYLLYDLDSKENKSAEERALFQSVFSESVATWEVTPLANSIALAKEVSVSPKRMNGSQMFRAWRIGNIITMFRVNNFLTYLDRRHIDTGWAINGISTEAQCEQQVKEGNLDISAFMFHALRKWYGEHPDSYSFTNPDDSLSANKDAWLSTPVFYSAHEIPGFEKMYFDDGSLLQKGQQNKLRSTFLGVGIGKELNYIIYHTKPKKTRWISKSENTIPFTVQNGIDRYSPDDPVPGANREIQNAIIFCATTYQFAALFDDLRKDKRSGKAVGEYGYPYITMSIIPVNTSGVIQLHQLMLSTPENFIQKMTRQLIQKNAGFIEANDLLFPLGYQNKPVLLAYDMEYYRLRRALSRYNGGQRFYIACYPEQAKFLSVLFPDAEFL